MSKSFRLVSMIVMMVMLFAMAAGCAPAAPAAETVTEAPPPEKKTFVFGRYMDAVNPDPVMNDANADIWYMQQYYSGLMRFNKDNQVEPDLAARYEVSEDQLTWTYYLRPDLKFADGSPITPEDWLWSLNRARDPNNGIWSFTFEAVEEITADAEKVVFKLMDPYTPFMFSPALFNAVVMPQKLVEAAGGWEPFMEKPIGAGPYIMKEWKRGESMLLVKNPYYWDATNINLDEILVKTIPDDNTRIISLQAGEVDAINYPPFNRIPELRADKNLTVLTFPSTKTGSVTLNIRNEPLSNLKVREALSYAMDRQALIDTINFGVGTVAKTFRPPDSLYFNTNVEGWPFDLEKAKALMAEAGYADGFKVTVQIVTGSESSLQLGTLLKDMWSKINVDLVIEPLESGLWNQYYYDNQFEMQFNYWTDDIPDPSQSVNYSVVYSTAESFHTGFQNDEIDQLASDALKTPDGPEREAMYFRIQEIFNENIPFIPTFHDPLMIVTRSNVQNFYQTPLGTYIWRQLDVVR